MNSQDSFHSNNLRSSVNRRDLFKTAAATALALGYKDLALLSPASAAAPTNPSAFNHRGYLGWITDLASQADANTQWPSMELDEQLLEDYKHTFDIMKILGFNEISVWGFYVSRNWPVTIEDAVSPQRGKMVERLIDAAHRRGIGVYSGLGLYSWGFVDIIKANPHLARTNSRAMCASCAEAWQWMQKIIDFVFSRFDIDGVSMQSADQGRCNCPQCRQYSDAEYHALLNIRAAEYIRSKWPKKTIAVNSWGLRFGDKTAKPALVRMSEKIDYLIDVHNSSCDSGRRYRKELIDALACDFGTLGGPQVEPPQHWERSRWFIPTPSRVGKHLRDLHADAGRACEFFFHILANPGDEITTWTAGKTLADPATPWQKHLTSSVERLYEITAPATRDGLVQAFLDAENAYFGFMPADMCGTFSLEPLMSDHPGQPVYLRERLNQSQRAEYARRMKIVRDDFEKLLPDIRRKDKVRKVLTCIDNAVADATG